MIIVQSLQVSSLPPTISDSGSTTYACDPGDILLVAIASSYLSSAITPPAASGTVPQFNLVKKTANSAAGVYYGVATGTSVSLGTWSNAGLVNAHLVKGANATTPIGGSSIGNGTSTMYIPVPAFTPVNNSGSSLFQFFSIGSSSTGSSATAPKFQNFPASGFTHNGGVYWGANRCVVSWRKNVSTSLSDQTITTDGYVYDYGCATFGVELLAK